MEPEGRQPRRVQELIFSFFQNLPLQKIDISYSSVAQWISTEMTPQVSVDRAFVVLKD